MLIPGPPLGLGGGIRTPCRMHSRNLIASRASESGTVNGHHTLVPAIPGHRLCAVLGPAHSPPHYAAFVFIDGKLRLGNGKRNFLKSRAGEGEGGRRQRMLFSLSTVSAFRRTQLLQPPDSAHTDGSEMSGPGCLVQGTLLTEFPLGG